MILRRFVLLTGALLTATLSCAANRHSHSMPAGVSVAYLAQHEGYWQVFVHLAGATSPIVVTESAGDKTRVSWFPDGSSLLVNSLDGSLFTVAVESGYEQAVPLSMRGMADAVLSPSGDTVAFSLTPTGGRDKNDIWILDLESSNVRRAVARKGLQDEPCWSPSGSQIFFSGGDGTIAHDLFRVDLATGSSEQLTAGSNYHVECAVSSNGHVAYSGNQSGAYNIYSFDPVSQAGILQWTDSLSLDATPAWLPNEAGLLFSSTRSGVLNLWSVAEPGAPPRQVTFTEEGARSPAIHFVAERVRP